MPQRPCDQCGTAYSAKRPASRFCSPLCRKRASRSPVPATPIAITATPVDPPSESTTAVVRAALIEHGRLLTPHGMTALRIAERLDSPSETGAAIASLSTKLTESMDRALDGVNVVDDPLDELRARRAKRASG